MALAFVPRCSAVLALVVTSLSLVACGGAGDDAVVASEDDLTRRAARFELFKGIDGQHYFQLIAGNGERLLQSEGYASKQGAQKGIASVRTNGVAAENYDVLVAKNDDLYFNLVAQNGEIIGTSELYASVDGAERAVDTVVDLIGKVQREEAAATGGARFEVFKGLDGQHYFHLRGGNGEIMLQSEGYTQSSSAKSGITSVRENGKVLAHYEIIEANNGQYFFNLEAGNGEVIAQGETYASKSSAERAAETLVALLASEKVADAK